ncbi:MAG: formylglycine-generating enzyme family protein [Lewinella sp.]|nr:formylglycine-generating enzyme family protein [Lewinella sp.]
MIRVEGGEFLMGSENEEAYNNEKPVHKVKVDAFYMGRFPVTQVLWVTVMEDNPSNFRAEPPGMRPVEQISWHDAQAFIKKLNKLTGKNYRLPTEAEWEYAARGGKESQGYKYAGSDKLKEVGWYRDISHGETKPVGQKDPNELGLYDMSGNVFEWVKDHWHDDYNGAPDDGSAWNHPGRENANASRVRRGGSWDFIPGYCRVSSRSSYDPEFRAFYVGFRLVLPSGSVGR